ncbi:hypothetical protein OKW50_006886 [Paraburkholderia youngii]
MAPRRDVRRAAWRTAPAVACGRRAWRRTRLLLQKRRDKAAAKRFFKRVLRSRPVPRKIVTDQLSSCAAAKAEIPELVNVKHVFAKAAARLNNRAENSHQPTREREPPHARLSRPETHSEISLVLRADQATLRAQATSAARFTLSQTARGAIRRLVRTHQSHPNSVVRVLRGVSSCRLSASVSISWQSPPDSLQTTLSRNAIRRICDRHGSSSGSLILGLPIWSRANWTRGHASTNRIALSI